MCKKIQTLTVLLISALFVAVVATDVRAQEDIEPWLMPEAKTNKVELIRFSHEVNLQPQTYQLSLQEKRNLNAFLNRIQLGYGDEVALDAGDAPDSDLREVAVRAYLKNQGIKVEQLAVVSGEAPSPNSVRLVVGRYVVTTPACPDWRKPPEFDYKNTPSSNLGCSTATNLGLMIANPRDLVAGQGGMSPDPVQAADAVNMYRFGEVEEPEEISITVLEGSGGGGGN